MAGWAPCNHCFSWPSAPRRAVSRAIGLGNDTDTLAAMAAAPSGARLGVDAIPAHLLERLEDGVKGSRYLHDLANRLHGRYEGGLAGAGRAATGPTGLAGK